MVVVHSFDGLVAKADKLANKTLHLHVFALKETTKPDDIAKNYYLEEDYFVIHSLKDKLSAQFIRLEVTEMIKNSEELYEKAGREIILRTDEELLKSLDIFGVAKPESKVTKVELNEIKPVPEMKVEETKTTPKDTPKE